MSGFTVGQTLIFVPDHHVTGAKEPREVRVEAIGRKWLKVSNGARIDKLSLEANGGIYASPGRCYFSRADYDAEKAADDAWTLLRQRFGLRPAGVMADSIIEATRLLGLS